MDVQALGLSLRLATATTLVLLALGTPLAYWLARTRRRWKVLIEAVVALPLVLPPTVLGFYVLLAISPRGVIGRWYGALTGDRLPFTFRGLLVASVLYSLPFAVQPMVVAFGRIERGVLEASWTLGEGGLATFLRTALPMALPGVATAAILAFAHTLGEFGVVLMVGGSIPGETRTISISIYDHVQALDHDAAGETALVLLVVSFVVLAVTAALQRRVWAPWPVR